MGQVGEGSVRVGVEGSAMAEPATGVGQYVHALWREFSRGLPGVEPVLLLPGPAATLEDMIGPLTGEVVVEEPPRRPVRLQSGKGRKLWWEQVGLPSAARRAGVDLVHVTHSWAPLRRDRPYVVTIHDLVPLVYPVYANTRQARLYLRFALATAARADLILTDSSHAAGDIARLLRVPTARIRVIPLAAGEEYRPLPAADPAIVDARAKFGLGRDDPFVFNVGGLDWRKNLVSLVRAFALARPRLPQDTRLVIGGAAHSGHPDRYPDLAPVVAEAGVGDRTIFTGRISEGEKLALLNAAAAYVYPSLYEGFGLSPLEAMRCGVPTICADRSSLPEVVGDGGLLVEPTPEDLAAAMVRVLNSSQERDDLRRRALASAARFSWARTAGDTAAAYREVRRTKYEARTGRSRYRKARS